MLPFDLLQVHEESFEVPAELGIELSPRFASFFNDGVFHDSTVHELLRSINQGWLETVTSANRVNTWNGDRIRDVRAVPGEQVVEAVYRGRGDVQRIFVRFSRNACSHDQSSGKIKSFARNLCEAQFLRDGNTCSRQTGITTLRFAQHDRRDVKLEVLTTRLPPFVREFLIRRHARILAWSRDQVADDARFDVHRGRHERTLTDRNSERKRFASPTPIRGSCCGGTRLPAHDVRYHRELTARRVPSSAFLCRRGLQQLVFPCA